MNIQNAKKFGFWTALSMVVGSVVGIGIFIKNNSVFRATGGNGIATLLAWIFGGVISLFCALSFAEISKSATSTNGGLGDYSKKYVGRWLSNFVKINYSILYFGVLTPALAYFTFIFFAIATGASITPAAIIIVLVVGPLLSIGISFFTPNLLKNTMAISVVVKFLPLILAALIGLWMTRNGGGIKSELPGWGVQLFVENDKGELTLNGKVYDLSELAKFTNALFKVKISDGTQTIEKFVVASEITSQNIVEIIGVQFKTQTFSSMLVAMPMVLFAYDAFLGVGSIAKNVKNAERNVPLAVFAGMIFVAVLYTLITISQLMQNQGSIAGTLESVLNSKALSKIVSVIIVFSAIGTTLSVSAAQAYITKDLIESDILPFSGKLLKGYKNDPLRAGAVFSSVIAIIFGLTFYLVSYFVEGGDMLDEMSNMPTLFFYVIYAIVMIGFVVAKIKEGKFGGKVIYLLTISVLASLGITLIVGYQFYELIRSMVQDGFASEKGLMIKNVTLILYTFLFFTLPIITLFIKNKFEQKNSFGNSITNAFKLTHTSENIKTENVTQNIDL